MMATESVAPIRRLKVKFPKNRTEADHGSRSYDRGTSLHDCQGLHNDDYRMEKISVSGGSKREATGMIEGHKEKRQKLDRNMTLQCSAILNTLISHDASWIFTQPVDPVALNIPDYFDIISSPMDLGTIKSKLAKNLYSCADEFAADVRLTFSNAMLYNPPSNFVHRIALDLNQSFEARWKVLEDKYNHESSTVRPIKSSSGPMKGSVATKQNNQNAHPLSSTSVCKRAIPSKVKIRRCSINASSTEVEYSKTAENCMQKSLGRTVKTGTEFVSCKASCFLKRPSSPTAKKCISCGTPCRCILPNISNDVCSSERSLGKDYCSSDISRLDCQAKSSAESHMSKSDQDSDGAISALDDLNICTSSQLSTPVTNATCEEGCNTSRFDVRLSPEKALRAAMLKKRFADTILKAQQKTILDHGDVTDPSRIQEEKKRLERRLREEKAKIEAEVRAAEAASRRAEIELKQKIEKEREEQIEKEREAARAAIEKMERSVVIEQYSEIKDELEKLGRCSSSILERLGLFMKDEYLADEDDYDDANLNGDGEEGEIF